MAGPRVRDAVPITPAVVQCGQQLADDFCAAGLIPGNVDFATFPATNFNNLAGGSS